MSVPTRSPAPRRSPTSSRSGGDLALGALESERAVEALESVGRHAQVDGRGVGCAVSLVGTLRRSDLRQAVEHVLDASDTLERDLFLANRGYRAGTDEVSSRNAGSGNGNLFESCRFLPLLS